MPNRKTCFNHPNLKALLQYRPRSCRSRFPPEPVGFLVIFPPVNTYRVVQQDQGPKCSLSCQPPDPFGPLCRAQVTDIQVRYNLSVVKLMKIIQLVTNKLLRKSTNAVHNLAVINPNHQLKHFLFHPLLFILNRSMADTLSLDM